VTMQGAIQISWPEVIAGCVFASSAVFANWISFGMIRKINERVPENERISYLYLGLGAGVRKRFKQLYPGNKLVLLLDCWVALMILCFVLGIKFWVFG